MNREPGAEMPKPKPKGKAKLSDIIAAENAKNAPPGGWGDEDKVQEKSTREWNAEQQAKNRKMLEERARQPTQGTLFTRKSLLDRQRAFVKAGKTCALCQKPMHPERDAGHQSCENCRKPRPADAAKQTSMFGKARVQAINGVVFVG
jgi:hypothetical protein